LATVDVGRRPAARGVAFRHFLLELMPVFVAIRLRLYFL